MRNFAFTFSLTFSLTLTAVSFIGPGQAQTPVAEKERRLAAIHDRFVFADVHAHPSAFHRDNVERIDSDEPTQDPPQDPNEDPNE